VKRHRSSSEHTQKEVNVSVLLTRRNFINYGRKEGLWYVDGLERNVRTIGLTVKRIGMTDAAKTVTYVGIVRLLLLLLLLRPPPDHSDSRAERPVGP
jgi:hypothetical protein